MRALRKRCAILPRSKNKLRRNARDRLQLWVQLWWMELDGRRREVEIPGGMSIINARGRTLLPGLWEMHVHFSGVEFGPALLAAGITTARDCGGEFDYLVAQRDAATKDAL